MPPLAPVIVLASGKGGVGKSTLALALADVLATQGMAVALVDFDPQGGVTLAAGQNRPESPLTADPVTAHGFTLVRSSRALAEASAAALGQRLDTIRQTAALVLVDLSPALTDAAHAATLERATLLLVCARCDAAGLPNVAEAVALGNSAGVAVAIVPTFRTTTGLSREAEAFLRGRYGDRVVRNAVPQDAKAAESAGAGKPVTQTAKRAKVSQAVVALATELAGQIGVRA